MLQSFPGGSRQPGVGELRVEKPGLPHLEAGQLWRAVSIAGLPERSTEAPIAALLLFTFSLCLIIRHSSHVFLWAVSSNAFTWNVTVSELAPPGIWPRANKFWSKVKSSNCVPLFQEGFDSSRSFAFTCKFQMRLSMSTKKPVGIWIGIVWSLWISLGLRLTYFRVDIQLFREHLLKRLSFPSLNYLDVIISSANRQHRFDGSWESRYPCLLPNL